MTSRTAAARAAPSAAPAGSVAPAGEVLLFRGPDEGLVRPYLLAPLDPDQVEVCLSGLGFQPGATITGPGGQVSQEWDRQDPGTPGQAVTHYLDGALTLVSVGLRTEPSPGFSIMMNALVELAFQLEARLVGA